MPLVDTLRERDDAAAGLIRTTADDSKITGYEADRITFDDQNDSVEGLVSRIIDKHNPIQRQAEARARAQAARRGMGDSTMAVQAAQAAALDYAVPIATTDAGNRLTVKAQNANATNSARANLAGAQQQSRTVAQQTQAERTLLQDKANIDSRLATEQAGHEVGLIRARGEEESRLAAEQEVFANNARLHETNMQQLRGEQALEVTALEQQFRTIQETIQSTSNYYMAFAQGISQILAEPDITVENKQQLVDRMMQTGRGIFGFISALSNFDLKPYIDEAFGPATGGGSTPTPSDGRPSWYPPGLDWPPVIA